ncbi:MAG TPA: glycosyltransferase [Acidobacteriaceae bacterium]|nr:glycosyltransferase [Acidobacteriaceae bacterium]
MESITAGGTERQILQIAELLRQGGFETTVATLRGTEWLTSEIAGCPVYHANVLSFWERSSWLELQNLRRWMRRERFHVLTTFFDESSCLGGWLTRGADIPALIGARRNLGTHVPLQWRIFLRLTNRHVDQFHANCEAVRQKVIHFDGIDPSLVHVVYNGIDLARFDSLHQQRQAMRDRLGLPADAIVYGMVSGLRPEKGAGDFLEAARRVIPSSPRAHFVIVGDGEQRKELEGLLDSQQLRARIQFVGAQKDVRPYLAAMDVGVLSSRTEGLSNSILEYLAARLPVIATSVGGNKEAAGCAGLMVPAKDPAALAVAMQQMQDDVMRRVLSKHAYAQAQCFSLEQAGKRLSRLYSELLHNKRPDIFPSSSELESSLQRTTVNTADSAPKTMTAEDKSFVKTYTEHWQKNPAYFNSQANRSTKPA